MKLIFFKVSVVVFLLGAGFLPGCGGYDSGAELKNLNFVSASKVRFIGDNVDSWQVRLKLLEGAKQSILVKYFIVENDDFGLSFMGMLLKKAQEGLEVKVCLDARGTGFPALTPLGFDYMEELAEAGVEIKIYNSLIIGRLDPLSFFDLLDFTKWGEMATNLFISDHDKMIWVDDRYLLTGGRNISHSYFLDVKDFPEVYLDADILLDAPDLAPRVKTAFYKAFNATVNNVVNVEAELLNIISRKDEMLNALAAMQNRLAHKSLASDYAPEFPNLVYWNRLYHPKEQLFASAFAGQKVTFLSNSPESDTNRFEITKALLNLIEAAKQEIVLLTPYVVLTDEMKDALIAAGKRGVKIKLITNGPVSTDSYLTQSVFVGEWKEMFAEIPNLQIFAGKGPAKLHAKVFIFDRISTMVGTFNFDYISSNDNSEMVVLVEGTEFSAHVGEYVEQTIRDETLQLDPGTNGSPYFGPENMPGAEDMYENLEIMYDWLVKYLKARL